MKKESTGLLTISQIRDSVNKNPAVSGAKIFSLNDKSISSRNVIPTPSLSLNAATGIGGFPYGRIIEVYGGESSGKTTLCAQTCAVAQNTIHPITKKPNICAYIDSEHATDPAYFANLGVNLDDLMFSQPDTLEQSMNLLLLLIHAGVTLIIVDSIASLVPEAELLGDVGNIRPGLQALLMGQSMRKITGICNKKKATVIFINQIREKIGVVYGCFHGQTKVTLSNGDFMPIQEIVEKKLGVEVLSYDEKTNSMVSRKVIDWHINGRVESPEDFLNFKVEGYGGGGIQEFCCTKDHQILTSLGWKPAKEINVNDSLMTQSTNVLGPEGYQNDFVSLPSPNTILSPRLVLEKRTASNRQMRNTNKYDITVEGSHTYCVGGNGNGVVVHNSPETTPGGKAIKFYASMRMKIKGVKKIGPKGEPIGSESTIEIVKNKMAPPFREAEVSAVHGFGINPIHDIINTGISCGVIEKSGAWISYKGERLGQGIQNSINFVLSNKDMIPKISNEVGTSLGFSEDSVKSYTDYCISYSEKLISLSSDDGEGVDDYDSDSSSDLIPPMDVDFESIPEVVQ